MMLILSELEGLEFELLVIQMVVTRISLREEEGLLTI